MFAAGLMTVIPILHNPHSIRIWYFNLERLILYIVNDNFNNL